MTEHNENLNNMQTMDDLPQAPEGYEAPEPQEEQPQEEQQAAPQETDKEINLRNLREAKEKAERERDELIAHFKKMQESQYQQQPKQKAPVEDEDPELAPDDLVEARYFNKKIKRLEEKLEQQYAQQRQSSDEARIKQQYPDFDKVVTEENIAAYRNLDPEGADIIANSNVGLYTKASRLYKELKRSGIIPDETYAKDREKAQTNSAKPKPLTSMNSQQGVDPLSKANAFAQGLTEDVKAAMRKEMEEARRRM